MTKNLVQRLNAWGPVAMGVGFLAPLSATILNSAGYPTVFGVSAIEASVIVFALWGLYAKVRGSWL